MSLYWYPFVSHCILTAFMSQYIDSHLCLYFDSPYVSHICKTLPFETSFYSQFCNAVCEVDQNAMWLNFKSSVFCGNLFLAMRIIKGELEGLSTTPTQFIDLHKIWNGPKYNSYWLFHFKMQGTNELVSRCHVVLNTEFFQFENTFQQSKGPNESFKNLNISGF